MANISVIGLGKLGACMAACFAARGHNVWGVDKYSRTVDLINRGVPPVYEPGLETTMAQASGSLRATTSFKEAVHNTDITFIAVPTPSTASGGFALDHVLACGREIGRALSRKRAYHVVVLTSTVLPGATEGSLKPLLEAQSGRVCGRDFGLCYSPEFIALGTVVRDFLNPDFVLIGESDARAGDAQASILTATIENGAPLARMSIVNAELTKLAVNTFVTTKIAFANMLSEVCERLPGGDVDVVTGALGLDQRIGPRYLKGGMPFGGPCFPRDNRALAHMIRELGLEAGLPEAVDAGNAHQLQAVVARVRQLVQRGPVAVLGLSYKPGSPVVEASPAHELALELSRSGLEVRVFDRLLAHMSDWGRGSEFAASDDLAAVVAGAEVIVAANPDPELLDDAAIQTLRSSGAHTLIDCWRLFDGRVQELHPLRYVALGRSGIPA